MQISGSVITQRISQLRFALKVLADGEEHPREKIFPDAKKKNWPSVVLMDLKRLGLVEFIGPATRHRKYVALVSAAELAKVDPAQVLLMPKVKDEEVARQAIEATPQAEGSDVNVSSSADSSEDSNADEDDVASLLARRLADLTSAVLMCNEEVRKGTAKDGEEAIQGRLDILFEMVESMQTKLHAFSSVDLPVRLNNLHQSIQAIPPETEDLYSVLIADLQTAFDGLNASFNGVRDRQTALEAQLIKMDAHLDAREAKFESQCKNIQSALEIQAKDIVAVVEHFERGTKNISDEYVASNRKIVDALIKKHVDARDDLKELLSIMIDEEKTSRNIIKKVANFPMPMKEKGPSVASSILAWQNEQTDQTGKKP